MELSHFFQAVYVPRRVQQEASRKGRRRYKLGKLFDTGFFKRCRVADETRIELLTIGALHEGEAEALVQAQERGAGFFIGDDLGARRIAEAQGLRPVGTTRILARLSLEGRAGDTRGLIQRLRNEVSFFIADDVIERAIATASEPLD